MRIPTPTLGEILLEEFMQPLSLSTSALSKETGISEQIMKGIVDGSVKVTADISSKLGAYFGMSESFFYRLQVNINARNSQFIHEGIRERELQYA